MSMYLGPTIRSLWHSSLLEPGLPPESVRPLGPEPSAVHEEQDEGRRNPPRRCLGRHRDYGGAGTQLYYQQRTVSCKSPIRHFIAYDTMVFGKYGWFGTLSYVVYSYVPAVLAYLCVIRECATTVLLKMLRRAIVVKALSCLACLLMDASTCCNVVTELVIVWYVPTPPSCVSRSGDRMLWTVETIWEVEF